MLIWIPSLISVPPTAPSVVCQPRFKMQSRANFPSSQLQIISNFEFPRNFPDFRLRQFFLVLNFAAFHPNLCAISLIFPAAPSVFPSPGSIPCLELLVGWAAWKGGLVDLVSSWSSSLIDMPTYFNHHHHHHLPLYQPYAYLLHMPTYTCLYLFTTYAYIFQPPLSSSYSPSTSSKNRKLWSRNVIFRSALGVSDCPRDEMRFSFKFLLK